jgi:hypothetical protein
VVGLYAKAWGFCNHRALTPAHRHRPILRMQLPLVFLQGPWKLSMGLNALDPADWLWVDHRFTAETTARAALIAERPDEVHAMLPGAKPAAEELLAAVRDHFARHHPDVSPTAGGVDEPPLVALGRMAQEDFCLMQRRPDGQYALTAAILCFPSHWHLREKLGRPMAEIHAPVPGFNARLGGPADRFFANLQVERPVWRANWTLVESPDLFHPQPRETITDLSSDNAGQLLWLRVERQTLRRLPESKAVVFTIRTLIEPLADIAREPAVAQAMAARIREMDDGMAGYKGIPTLREPLLAYLDRLAEQPRAAFA